MLLLSDANIICNENRVGYLCMHKQNTYNIHKHEPPTKQKRTEHTDSKGCFFAYNCFLHNQQVQDILDMMGRK